MSRDPGTTPSSEDRSPPDSRLTPCAHAWKFRDDIPVLDFGKLGIKTYECEKCGAMGESDPFDGVVKETT